jgi:hypothetical protein
MTYTPRGMPRRFLQDAPPVVRRNVLDLIEIKPGQPLEYDVILRPEPDPQEIVGVDFGNQGERGCHFFLSPHEMRAYRERSRRHRVAWADLPERTQSAIVAYLESDECPTQTP